MAFPSVTYTFTNGATSDGSQVSQNFTDLINGASDGTKAYNIAALTAAGTATLNGSVALGASSANTVTWNGSLVSSIPISVTNTYDFGSDAFGLRSVYLGSASTSHSTRLIGASVSAAWTLTLPNGVPTFTNSVPVSDGSGTLSFAQRSVLGVKASQIALFTAGGGDEFTPLNATAGSFTVTLPSPSATGMSGKVLWYFSTGTSFVNVPTIQRNSSEKIYGADSTNAGVNSIILATPGEMFGLITDGTNWFVKEHTYPKVWTTFTMSITGSVGNPTKANTTLYDLALWRRLGDGIQIRYDYGHSNNTGTANGTGTYLFTLPNSWSMDTTKVTANTTNATGVLGNGSVSGTNVGSGHVKAYDSTHLALHIQDVTSAAQSFWGTNYVGLTSADVRVSFIATVPISGFTC